MAAESRSRRQERGEDAALAPRTAEEVSRAAAVRVARDLACAAALRDVRAGRRVTDEAFDRIYPDAIRKLSHPHWTPVEIARRAAALLVEAGATHVLDVGSGAGKFCLVGALTTRAKFTGVEQRAGLVDVARLVARTYDVPRVRFVHGDMRQLDWARYDGFYLFNPFLENRLARRDRIDDVVAMSSARYYRERDFVYEQLAAAAPGTRVVTFYGYGGGMPDGYERRAREGFRASALELWVRGG